MALNKKLFVDAGGGGIVPSENFKTVLYDGNGSTKNITTVGFKPDFIWIKARNGTGSYHALHDTIRGAHLQLRANLPNAPFNAGTNGVTAFNDNGFSLKDDSAGGNNVNGANGGTYSGNPAKYVSWNWKFGGNANTFNKDGVGFSSASAAGLTAGTTAPSASSINTVAGHSMVKVTTDNGADKTIPHGLGVKPSLVIWKRLDSSEDGWTYTDEIDGSHDYVVLNKSVVAQGVSTAVPTTSVVSAPTEGVKTYIAYMFASKTGFSLIDVYTGNGGNKFIECGFEPAFIIAKATNFDAHWVIYDNKRSPSNPRDVELYPNTASVELNDSRGVDFNSTGFQLDSSSYLNTENRVYLFYAIAN